ncbi:MAG: EF-hand domain-containing protein [Acidobacteria bacterium]|nr:EF-hand domain-containing protein [Acidobacteriota bacterium]
MKRVSLGIFVLLVLSLTGSVFAQVTDRQGKRGRKGGKIFKKMDANNDQQISRGEWSRKPKAFDRLDRNHDGILTMEELREARQNHPRRESNNSSGTP